MAECYDELTIYTDGACSGNPGPAGIGVVFYHDDVVVKELSRYLGEATNNIAEYTALIYGLQQALKFHTKKIHVFTDSELMYKQIIGAYKVKQPHIQKLFDQVKHLQDGFAEFHIAHVLRAKNKAADQLATDAIKNLETA